MALQSDTQNMGCVITASVCPLVKSILQLINNTTYLSRIVNYFQNKTALFVPWHPQSHAQQDIAYRHVLIFS